MADRTTTGFVTKPFSNYFHEVIASLADVGALAVTAWTTTRRLA